MDKIIILGSANAIPDLEHDNSHLLVQAGSTIFLVDCSSSPVQRLQKAGVMLDSLNHILFTHFHPDHVSGAPLLFMVMWLEGRKAPLHLYGLATTLEKIQQNMQLYDYESWPGFFNLMFHPIPETEKVNVFEDENLLLTTSPVNHLIPTIGLKVDFKQSGKSILYTSDTEPCEAVVMLAKGVNLLVHEAAGGSRGHSSPEQAAQDAEAAGAKSLLLIHYDYNHPELPAMLERAKMIFHGKVTLAEDFMEIDVS